MGKTIVSTDLPKRAMEEGRVPGSPTQLEVFSQMLGRIFSVRLEVPEDVLLGTEKKVKEFCVGLLENPVNHAWWPSVRGLGERERMSVSASLFLFRKTLGSPPDPLQFEKHARLMSAPAPEPPPGYLDFITREVDEMFPVGWDRGYRAHVFSHSPSSSSCLDFSRSRGGARRFLGAGGVDWFEDRCLSGEGLPTDYSVKYEVVRTSGKNRGVTIAPGDSHVLGPLHRTLYDHLSQFEWLLRGDARGKKFKGFHKVEGEVFVSGDYESATDNLSLFVACWILSRIFSRSKFIPDGMKDYALRSLQATIHYPGGLVVQQQRGQLMGNFLSFPLLCLQNYLAFRFLVPRRVPVRINGDDIVFRCLPSECARWKEGVGALGLVLSAGKTLVSKATFSLNSAFFLSQVRRVREIPVIRSSMCVPGDGLPSAETFTRFIRGWKLESRRLLGGYWLRSHRKSIQSSGRSVVEGLGIPADNSQLHTAGLSVREAFYRGSDSVASLPERQVPPVPLGEVSRLTSRWRFLPPSVVATGPEKARWQSEFRRECSEMAWLAIEERPKVLWDRWWDDLRKSGCEFSWLSWKRTTKKVHRMGCKLNLRLRPPKPRRPRRGWFWIPLDEVAHRLGSERCGVGR